MLSYPEHTKQTRCNNDINSLRPVTSNQSIPINSNHDHYIFDSSIYGGDRNSRDQNFDMTRNSISSRTQVQQNFQNNYYTMSFDNMNNHNNQEINNFLTRNPVNTRRDNIEKVRNSETQDYMKTQGGILGNFIDIKHENTRKYKDEINSSNYIPMPKTMAIPKENV